MFGRSPKTTCCSSSCLCFLGCPAFEEVELSRCGICGAQCGLSILFLVTEHSASDIHIPTARTDGSCLGMGENTGLRESRASSPVQADISAVTWIRSLSTEDLLRSLMKKTALCRSIFPNIETWDEICTKTALVSGLWDVQFLRVNEAGSSGEWCAGQGRSRHQLSDWQCCTETVTVKTFSSLFSGPSVHPPLLALYQCVRIHWQVAQ